jgi:hypothetical protein
MAKQKTVKTVREMLAPGKRLDRGCACEVAALILKNPRKTGEVVECLWDEDAGVANRAADALERASGRRPEILGRWKEALLDRMLDAGENKLRWNLALMMTRTLLTEAETIRAAMVLRSWLDDKSSIVKTSAMHGLAGLTRWDPSMLPEVLDMLRVLSRSGTPAMRARGRILLKRMEAGKELPVITGPLLGLSGVTGTRGGRSKTRTIPRKSSSKALQAVRY